MPVAHKSMFSREYSCHCPVANLQGGEQRGCPACRNVRSMIGESTDFTSQAIAFGYLGLAFGVGTVLGPLIGGTLTYPCNTFGASFPLCGPGQLNDARPFFLPCLGAALISACAAASNIFVLRETLPAIQDARRAAAEAAAERKELAQPLLAGSAEAPDLEGGAPRFSPALCFMNLVSRVGQRVVCPHVQPPYACW